MIGNKYLQELYLIEDEDLALSELLEMLTYKDKKFIQSMYETPVDLSTCNTAELTFLTKVVALIDYFFQLHKLEVPRWIRDDRLTFEYPYYHPKRLSDFDKVRLQFTNPGPFRRRNVYFDMDSLKRV